MIPPCSYRQSSRPAQDRIELIACSAREKLICGGSDDHSIDSTLPVDDPDLCEITLGFFNRSPSRLSDLKIDIAASDFDTVCDRIVRGWQSPKALQVAKPTNTPPRFVEESHIAEVNPTLIRVESYFSAARDCVHSRKAYSKRDQIPFLDRHLLMFGFHDRYHHFDRVFRYRLSVRFDWGDYVGDARVNA